MPKSRSNQAITSIIQEKKVNGFIKNLDWKNNPTKFDFRTSPEDDPKILTINTVREFGFSDNKKFLRATVNIDRSTSTLRSMSSDRNPNFEEEQLFLKFLVAGNASLFRYENGNLIRYFYKMEGDSIKQLIKKKYLVKDNSRVAANESYKQQLFNDLKCSSLSQRDIKNLHYDDVQLRDIFITYNTCSNGGYTLYDKKEKRDLFDLNVRLWLNNNNLTFQIYSPYNAIEETRFDTKLSFRAGIEGEFILPFTKNKWAFFIVPSYHYYKGEKKQVEGAKKWSTNPSRCP